MSFPQLPLWRLQSGAARFAASHRCWNPRRRRLVWRQPSCPMLMPAWPGTSRVRLQAAYVLCGARLGSARSGRLPLGSMAPHGAGALLSRGWWVVDFGRAIQFGPAVSLAAAATMVATLAVPSGWWRARRSPVGAGPISGPSSRPRCAKRHTRRDAGRWRRCSSRSMPFAPRSAPRSVACRGAVGRAAVCGGVAARLRPDHLASSLSGLRRLPRRSRRRGRALRVTGSVRAARVGEAQAFKQVGAFPQAARSNIGTEAADPAAAWRALWARVAASPPIGLDLVTAS